MFFVYKSEKNRKQNQTDNKLFLLIHKHLWFNILEQQTKAKNHFFY